ncbi:MAG: hypothetical protein ACRCZI_11395 [Cetobacterium sp.]
MGDAGQPGARESEVGPVAETVPTQAELERRAALVAGQGAPVLPDTRRARGHVQSILSRSDAEVVAAAFADLNRLHRAAEDAYVNGKDMMELIATKNALQAELFLLKLRHGTTVNVNAKITSQNDLPPYANLPPDVREQVSQLLNIVDAEAVEDDFGGYAPGA